MVGMGLKQVGKRRILLFFWIILLPSAVWGGGNVSLSNPQVYEVRQQYTLTKTGGDALNLRLEIPAFFRENSPPYQKVLSFQTSTERLKPSYSAQEPLLQYTVSRWKGNQPICLDLRYTIVNYAVDYQIYSFAGENKTDRRYLLPETGIESDNVSITHLASEITGQEMHLREKAVKIFHYVNSTLEYRTVEEQEHSALRTLQRGYGNCEDFTLVYIALCRAGGIPARFVSGYRLNGVRLEKGETVDLDALGHAWAEVNLPGADWVPVDPTFLYTVNGKQQENDDFFGKFRADDRHILLNYARDSGPRWVWQQNRFSPSTVRVTRETVIRRQK